MKLEKKIRRYKLIEVHQNLVREGKLFMARKLLHFLQNGSIVLGLSDDDYEVERILEKVGCRSTYGRNFRSSTVYL